MQDNNMDNLIIPLNEKEEKDLRDGEEVYSMTLTPGWQIVKKMLEDLAFHSWVDPKETNAKEEWVWREINAYHAASVAKQILETIETMATDADYLSKLKSGEITRRRLKI